MKPVSLSAAPAVHPAAVVPIALVTALPPPIALVHPVPPRAEPPPLPAASARPPSPPDAPSFPPDTVFTGEVLRRAREARGLTVQQLAERTRITRHHLENVEAERYGKLPPTVYLRGILTSVARELRLDPAAVAKTYLDLRAAAVVVGNGR